MDKLQKSTLERFDTEHVGLSKGSLSFVVTITRALKLKEFPVHIDDFKTNKEGQVKGLGGGAVRKILNEYGIDRTLSSEGGRTSRGVMEKARVYIDELNALFRAGVLNLDEIEHFWVRRIEIFFDSRPFTFRLDPAKSLRFCIRQLLAQAIERQREVKGTMFAGALMQHLVGAKLDRIVDGEIEHHGFAVADAPTNRSGDFLIGDVAFHVTTAPTDALIRKCVANLASGLRPVIITTGDGVGGAIALAKQVDCEDRIDIVEIEQFIATNLYEWSQFKRDARNESVREFFERYNKIVDKCETDPSFRVEFDS